MKYHKKRKSCKFGIVFFLMAVVLMCVLAINHAVADFFGDINRNIYKTLSLR